VSAQVESVALAKTEQPGTLARTDDDGISVERIVARVKKIRQIRDEVMQAGVHYGKIPGVKKDSLMKPGAETLCMAFALSPKFKTEESREGEHLECVVTCTLFGPSGAELGDGIGSCSTMESKYAYRKAEKVCPECGKSAIIKGKEEYGGGWVCFKKKDGCGAKFKDGDQAIEGQQVGRIANEDIADQYNTVRKMACKRAHVAATLFVTGASELFTQDVEDMPQHQRHDDRDAKPAAKPAPKAQPSSGNGKAPTEEEFDIAILDIGRAKTTDELSATAGKYRAHAWNAGHRKALKEAVDHRLAQLKDPEHRDPPDDEEAPW
jgi:hypothetical protein